MTELVAAWPDAVGETVAANAWPARLARDGTLHVHAASSTWAFELQQLESGDRGSPARGGPGGRAGPPALRRRAACRSFPRPRRRTRSRPPPEPTLEQAREAHELAAAIASEDLRKSVEKAARMSLASAADGRSAC